VVQATKQETLFSDLPSYKQLSASLRNTVTVYSLMCHFNHSDCISADVLSVEAQNGCTHYRRDIVTYVQAASRIACRECSGMSAVSRQQ
jgi:hypothetical protein